MKHQFTNYYIQYICRVFGSEDKTYHSVHKSVTEHSICTIRIYVYHHGQLYCYNEIFDILII